MKNSITVFNIVCILGLLFVGCGKEEDEIAKTGIVAGIVSDYSNANSPIVGATITVNPSGLSVTTGSDGRYEFPKLEPGNYTISVYADKYQRATKYITIYAGQTAICDFQLEKAGVAIDIAPQNLVFGRNVEQASFIITNNTNDQLYYSISNYPDYIQVFPLSGLLDAKGKQAVGLTLINRSSITTARNAQLTVNVGNDSYIVNTFIEAYREGDSEDPNDNGENHNTEPIDVEVVTYGLDAYYTFDNETAQDNMGMNDAFLNGGSFITNTPNGKGKAVQLNLMEFMTIGENPLGGKRSFSVSLWVKDFGTGVFLRATSGNYYDLSPTWNIDGTGKITYNTYDRRYSTFGTSLSNFSSKWTMITIVSDGNTDNHTLYINGSTASSFKSDGTMASTGCSLQIGGETWYSGGNYLGYDNVLWTSPMKIDNVRIYSRALSSSEVKTIYDAEK